MGRTHWQSDPVVEVVNGTAKTTVDRCPCGTPVCVGCHEIVKEEHVRTHVCAAAREKQVENDAATLRVLVQSGAGKPCPFCNNLVMKNGGCDYMMCGTNGKTRPANNSSTV